MSAQAIAEELSKLGKDSYKKVLFSHGIREPLIGVSIEEMKKIQKRVKKDYQLALDLYDTGIYDLMYLAGLIADDLRMTKDDLRRWLDKAYCGALSEITVAWVAAESLHGWELGLEWIESPVDRTAAAGWSTLGSLVGIKEDSELDLPALEKLIQRVESTIHQQPNCVRYTMNGFLIAVGTYVQSLTDRAIKAGEKIGTVKVELTGSCKVPSALDYIRKSQQRGTIGKKRKSAKC